jgi:hypothetical protein
MASSMALEPGARMQVHRDALNNYYFAKMTVFSDVIIYYAVFFSDRRTLTFQVTSKVHSPSLSLSHSLSLFLSYILIFCKPF